MFGVWWAHGRAAAAAWWGTMMTTTFRHPPQNTFLDSKFYTLFAFFLEFSSVSSGPCHTLSQPPEAWKSSWNGCEHSSRSSVNTVVMCTSLLFRWTGWVMAFDPRQNHLLNCVSYCCHYYYLSRTLSHWLRVNVSGIKWEENVWKSMCWGKSRFEKKEVDEDEVKEVTNSDFLSRFVQFSQFHLLHAALSRLEVRYYSVRTPTQPLQNESRISLSPYRSE